MGNRSGLVYFKNCKEEGFLIRDKMALLICADYLPIHKLCDTDEAKSMAKILYFLL